MLENTQNAQNQNISDFIGGVAGGSGVVQTGMENHNINIRLFENADFGKVRVIIKDGEPWFVAKDVCDILAIQNVTQAIERLDTDERSMFNIGRQGEANIISESGLYQLIFSSRKPEAKAFSKWVRKEVLPSIRKTGSYHLPTTYKEALRALLAEVERREIAEAERDEAIRTKAWIGSKREATAMQTASVLSKKVNALEDELGRGKLWKQVKAIPWLLDYFVASAGMYTAVGKYLSKISRANGYPIHKVESEEYGKVNSYHSDVIEMFFNEVNAYENVLFFYRLA